MPRPGPALVSVLCSGWLLSACHQASTPISLLQEGEVADLRITEPPWQPQELMTHRMQHLTAFLYNETGLKVRYVPAITYSHSYSLVERGEADLIVVGIFGGYRLTKSVPHAIPLVVQKPSYRTMMLGRKSWLEGLPPDVEPGLSSIQGSRVAFGSRFSGSTFMQPLLAMHEAGLDPSLIEECLHEPVHRHLPMQVANGRVDFVFAYSSEGKETEIPLSLSNELVVVWRSKPSRNDYLISAINPDNPRREEYQKKLQNAFLRLDQTTKDGRAFLETYPIRFELPTTEFPDQTNQRIDKLLSVGGGLPKCEAS